MVWYVLVQLIQTCDVYPVRRLVLYFSVFAGIIWIFPSAAAGVLQPLVRTEQAVIAHWLGPGVPVAPVGDKF